MGFIRKLYLRSSVYFTPLLLWLIIGAGMWLRIDRGDQFPIYQNDDGLFYVWAGNSIMDNFLHPTSLTIFETENEHLFWRSQYRNIVPAEQFGYRLSDPWFDHPFFASILIALPARIMGYTDFSQIPQMVVRIPAFIAAFFSLILTYVLGLKLFSKRTGLFAVAVLAFWPLAVFSSRQSYIENIMTPFWLGSLWLTWEMAGGKNKRKWLLTLLIGANIFLAWSKFIGYISFAVSIFWLLQARQNKKALVVGLAAVISALIYFGYGSLVGGSYFWSTLLHQGGRGAYLTSIFDILRSPDIFGIIDDGWWYIGWLSLLWTARTRKKNGKFVASNIIFWLIALFFLVGPANNSPWYRYPIYPLLALSTANLLTDWWQNKNIIISGLFLMLGLTGFKVAGIDVYSYYLRIIVIIAAATMALAQLKETKTALWLHRLLVCLLLIGSLVGNVLATRKYPYIRCKDGNCPTPTKIEVTMPNL